MSGSVARKNLRARWALPVAIVVVSLQSGCGGGGGGSSSSDTLQQGLIHWWRFNGHASDSAGNLSTTPIGPVTYTSSPTGKAIVFNGTTTGISLPPQADMQFQKSFTLSAWANLSTYPADSQIWATIIFDGDDRNGLDPYDLQVAPDGTLQFVTSGISDGMHVDGGTFPLHTWVLVTGTYDQAKGLQTLYVNGQQVGQNKQVFDLTPVVPLVENENAGVGIGTNNGFPNSNYNMGWNGAISDLRVYNRALSAAEVQRLFKNGKQGTP